MQSGKRARTVLEGLTPVIISGKSANQKSDLEANSQQKLQNTQPSDDFTNKLEFRKIFEDQHRDLNFIHGGGAAKSNLHSESHTSECL